MPGFTKEIIFATFMEILNEKPYAKITVKDIVERCGVNRNTFYYHFRDIPDLLEFALKRDLNEILEVHKENKTIGECLEFLVERMTRNKKAMLHIYNSMQREVFVRYLERAALYVVQEFMNNAESQMGITDREKELMVKFYKCLFMGTLLDWLDHGMDWDLVEDMRQFWALYDQKRDRLTSNIV